MEIPADRVVDVAGALYIDDCDSVLDFYRVLYNEVFLTVTFKTLRRQLESCPQCKEGIELGIDRVSI